MPVLLRSKSLARTLDRVVNQITKRTYTVCTPAAPAASPEGAAPIAISKTAGVHSRRSPADDHSARTKRPDHAARRRADATRLLVLPV